MELRRFVGMGIALAALVLGACSSGGGEEGPVAGGGAQATPGIGASGGVVQGPGGAQVSVPAGALTQNALIEIAQSGAGAPPLPAGVIAVGQTFAFTPHGTSFATPATVTVPFDPALVPAGAAVALYKTNAARSAWEVVAGATVSGSRISGAVSGFSFFTPVAPEPVTPSEPFPPHRIWDFRTHVSNHREVRIAQGELFAGVLSEQREFGDLIIAPNGHDLIARGEVFSNATGETYWVAAEAPRGSVLLPDDRIGGEVRLLQRQFFRKNAADATLRFVVTQAWIDAIDDNGDDPIDTYCPWARDLALNDTCWNDIFGQLDLTIALVGLPLGELHSAHRGIVSLWGWRDHWQWDFETRPFVRRRSYVDGVSDIVSARAMPIFRSSEFDVFVSDDGAVPGTRLEMRLLRPAPVNVDLSRIPVGGTFMIETTATALAHNRRGRESFVAARLRDPATADGIDWQTTGLETIAPVALTGPIVAPDPECTGNGATAASGTLQFSAHDYPLPEFHHGRRVVRVTRTDGSVGELIARVTTSDGTAIAGTHYEPVDQIVVFGDGDTETRAVEIPIIDDEVLGGPNTFNVSLSAVGACANIGTPFAAVVTILDDETPPPATYTVGGAVTGLAGTGLALREVTSGRDVTPTADGAFSFDYNYPNGTSYDVRVQTQPTNPLQICSVANGTGTIASASVTNVAVTCTMPQASGTLDAAFGQSGKVTADLVGTSAGARAIALQSDGRILAVGGMQLLRFNANGSVDTTFGTNGTAQIVFNGGVQDEALTVAVQNDSRILVAGYTRVGTQDDFAVARFNADGSPDTSFGTLGRISVPVYVDQDLPTGAHRVGGVDRAYKVLPLDSGAILVAGHGRYSDFDPQGGLIGSANTYAVARLNPDGTPDPTFDADGRATSVFSGADTALAYAAAVQADGRILVGGRYGSATGDPDLGIMGFNADGSNDAMFGFVTADLHGFSDEVKDLLVLPDGRVAVAAVTLVYASPTPVTQFTVVIFGADGTLLSSRSTPIGSGDDQSRAVALQADGKLLLAGSVSRTGGSDFGVVRYNADLTVDTGFGTNGVVTVDFFGSTDGANDVLVQPDGAIVAAGVVRNGSSWDLGLVRILP